MRRPCSSSGAAVVSGRWEEILDHTREAMAQTGERLALVAPGVPGRVEGAEDDDAESTQPSTKKHSKRTAA